MAFTIHHNLQIIFLSTIILRFPATISPQSECPYPCYPPPTFPGESPPAATSPPATTIPSATTTPPDSFSGSPPTRLFPYTPPSPYFYGVTPPPPEPIVNWFPYYYRKPPRQESSSSFELRESRAVILPLLVVIFLFLFL
ncbi:hydroxyproline-rich glycoprotein family protein [Striga hermonthica]|uniref:Hydroxyproline-rich glycoprotein family protein n=1 Tax=Striga hermonthica TaxID=68872 RepID=A0A9N7NPL6_STRHE|nr:hydroxyproline-rich glycoprotein family protein [Striga hermonthica]